MLHLDGSALLIGIGEVLVQGLLAPAVDLLGAPTQAEGQEQGNQDHTSYHADSNPGFCSAAEPARAAALSGPDHAMHT